MAHSGGVPVTEVEVSMAWLYPRVAVMLGGDEYGFVFSPAVRR